jgi:hypothetical protein
MLTTLRLRSVNAIAIRQLSIWTLPMLQRVIFDDPPTIPEALDILWNTFGEQIRCVELGRDVHFRLEDNVSRVLAACPSLRELNYRIMYTAVPSPSTDFAHVSLRCIGLHAASNCDLGVSNTGDVWDHLNSHFAAFRSGAFPALQKLVLYGEEWNMLHNDRRFSAIEASAKAVGQTILIAS